MSLINGLASCFVSIFSVGSGVGLVFGVIKVSVDIVSGWLIFVIDRFFSCLIRFILFGVNRLITVESSLK